MSSMDRAGVFWLNAFFRLCLCLAVVGTIVVGVDAGAAAAAATGSPPQIRSFTAQPMTLKDGGSAVYKFEVWDATGIQLFEAGELLREIKGVPSLTYKGKTTGRTTYQIRTGSGNTFESVLVARNAAGEQKKTLTLSFETKLQENAGSTGTQGSDNQTAARTPKWGPQASSPVNFTSTAGAVITHGAPQFAKCPAGCSNCLKPDEAAARGYTQRCLDQPCYYSPDDQQKWYCYSDPEGWCCQGGTVSEASRSRCSAAGGAWYASQADAFQACQPAGYCCIGGQVVPATKERCAVAGGSYWATSQAEVIRACQPQTYWCCRGGNVYQTNQLSEGCYATQAEALRACQQAVPCWCCTGGNVSYTTRAACINSGGSCYSSQSEAAAGCRKYIPLPRTTIPYTPPNIK